MKPGRNSLLNSILQQIYAPTAYQAGIFHMQIAVHLVKYADEFMGILDKFLEQKKLGFVDYVFAVARGEVWADEYIIAAITHMWNISISIISPGYNNEWKVFHDRELAQVYVVANGYRFRSKQKATHFSATESTLQLARKVGNDITDANIRTRSMYQQGRMAGTNRYLLIEKESLLRRHYNIGVTLANLEESLAVCRKTMNCVEGEMRECEISKDEILKYKKFQDHARLHVRSEMAIQISTEEMQSILQEGTKRPVIEGEEDASVKKIRVDEVRDTGEKEGVAVAREGGSVIVERQGEMEMVEGEEEAIAVRGGQGESKMVEGEEEEIAVRGGQGESEMVEEEEEIVVGGEIGAVGGEKEVQEVEEVIGVEGVGGAGIEVIKVVEVKSKGDPRKNRSQDGPVPEKDWIKGRFYCDKCSKSYTEQKALTRHQKKRCGIEVKEFKCGKCDKEYFHEEGLLEHLAAKHDGVPPHVCNVCQGRFIYRKQLREHKEVYHRSSSTVTK